MSVFKSGMVLLFQNRWNFQQDRNAGGCVIKIKFAFDLDRGVCFQAHFLLYDTVECSGLSQVQLKWR
jgi:hypothetical protein